MFKEKVKCYSTYSFKGNKFILIGFTVKYHPRVFLRNTRTEQLLIITWKEFLKKFELVSVHLKHDLNSNDSIEIHKKWLERPVDQYNKKGIFIRSFATIEEASKEFGRHPINIYNCARGDTITSAAFKWRFPK